MLILSSKVVKPPDVQVTIQKHLLLFNKTPGVSQHIHPFVVLRCETVLFASVCGSDLESLESDGLSRKHRP